MTEKTQRKMLKNLCAQLYDRRLTVSAGGNMSVRLDEESILITPSGRNKGMLEPEDMVRVTMEGEIIGSGRPSIETGIHLALYKANASINAVVHCHPLYCTMLSVKGEEIRTGLTPESIVLLRNIPMIEYHTPGSQELVDAIAKHASSTAMLLRSHGALTQGRNTEEAYNRMEELEFQAKMQSLVGNAEGLPKEEIDRILGVCE